MNFTPEIFGEICRQGAFISAIIAGFSFAFIGALLVSQVKNKIIDVVLSFSILSIAGLLICALFWTLMASGMGMYVGIEISQIPQSLISLHKTLSLLFILSILFFLVTLALSGWIRSRILGVISASVSVASTAFFFMNVKLFLH
ncbi:MAG TPA: hypothetical protein VHO50_11665 [Bacteroidales bacterium]|nr:hypothetical protein [Bacteroidales bacterium]